MDKSDRWEMIDRTARKGIFFDVGYRSVNFNLLELAETDERWCASKVVN